MIRDLNLLNKHLLGLFNLVLEPDPTITPPISPGRIEECINVLIEQYAVVLTPLAKYAGKDILDHVTRTRMNHQAFNTTFYTKWKTILNMKRPDFLTDEILHYASTCETGYTGQIYFPAGSQEVTGEKLPVFVVGAITKAEALLKTKRLLTSGTPLSSITIERVVEVLDLLESTIPLSEIKNEVAKLLIMKNKRDYDVPPEEFVRFLVYISIHETLVIKSPAALWKIKKSEKDLSPYIENYPHLDQLAGVYNRFKPIFLSIKKANTKNIKIINKLGRLSKIKHTAMTVNPLNCVTRKELEATDMHWLGNVTNSALLRALNCSRLYSIPHEGETYRIRNGRTWIRDKNWTEFLTEIPRKNFYTILEHYVSRIGPVLRGKKVYIPPGVEYGLPMSEKHMVGAIPMATKIHTKGEDLAVGIHWKAEYNVIDADLSCLDLDGKKIGWNSKFRENGITYSGDVTSPGEYGATEYLLFSNEESFGDLSAVLAVDCYQGNHVDWAYDIVCGRGNKANMGFLMDPSKVDFTVRCHSKQQQNFIGVVRREKDHVTFYFKLLSMPKESVTSVDDLSEHSTKSLVHAIEYGITLNELLFDHLGVEQVLNPVEADIDLSVNKISNEIFHMLQG